MPMARPAIVAVGVLTFVQYWSDFINPLLYLKSDARYTLSVGLRVLQQMDPTHGPLLLAGAVVMILPVLSSSSSPSAPSGCRIGPPAPRPMTRPRPPRLPMRWP